MAGVFPAAREVGSTRCLPRTNRLAGVGTVLRRWRRLQRRICSPPWLHLHLRPRMCRGTVTVLRGQQRRCRRGWDPGDAVDCGAGVGRSDVSASSTGGGKALGKWTGEPSEPGLMWGCCETKDVGELGLWESSCGEWEVRA